jgi:hypothetical protein
MPTLRHMLTISSSLAGCVVCHICEGSVSYRSQFADVTAENKSELVDDELIFVEKVGDFCQFCNTIEIFVAPKHARLACVLISLPSLYFPPLLSSILFRMSV